MDVLQVSIMGRGPEERLSSKRDKNHILFGGTKILQHTPDKVVYDVSINSVISFSLHFTTNLFLLFIASDLSYENS